MLFIILFVPLLSSVLTLILILIERALTVCFVSHNNDRIKQFMRVNINNKGRKEGRKTSLRITQDSPESGLFPRVTIIFSKEYSSQSVSHSFLFWDIYILFLGNFVCDIFNFNYNCTYNYNHNHNWVCVWEERERGECAWVVYALSAIQNYLQSQSKYKSRRIVDAWIKQIKPYQTKKYKKKKILILIIIIV